MPRTADQPQDSLTDDARGHYLVTTESGSRYWLDLDARLLRRVTGPTFTETLRLRRDGDDVDLIEIVTCALGEPKVVVINLNVPGVWFTTRETTTVLSIKRIADPPRRP